MFYKTKQSMLLSNMPDLEVMSAMHDANSYTGNHCSLTIGIKLCVCLCLCGYTYVWRSEVDIRCRYGLPAYLVWTRFFSEPGVHWFGSFGWLTSFKSSFSVSPVLGVQIMLLCPVSYVVGLLWDH